MNLYQLFKFNVVYSENRQKTSQGTINDFLATVYEFGSSVEL